MNKNTPEVYHQKLSTAFHSMIALPLAVFVYLFLENKHNELQPLLNDSIIINLTDYGLSIVAIVLTALAHRNFKKKLAGINREITLKKRFEQYSTIAIQNYILIGIASAVLIVGLILTNSSIFIVEYVILLFLLSLHRPTPDKYVRDLRLEGMEKKIVKNKEEFVD